MATREEIYAVLVPVHGDTLLLPNATVAEVLSADGLDAIGSGPRVGTRDWNGKRLRVVSFEILNGGAAPPDSNRARIVVLHPLAGAPTDSACGILAQGYPHLFTLNRAALVKTPLRDSDISNIVFSRVRIANTEALIPNLEAIQEAAA
ncbi:MAG: chemotaxis protein CheW [Pseudomonadota bacterium]|mgnify:CR=1 FL=1